MIGSQHPSSSRGRAAAGAAAGVDAARGLAVLLFDDFLDFHVLMSCSYLQQTMIASGSIALLRVQHSAYRKPSSSCKASVFAEYRRYVPSRRTLTSSSFFSLSR